MPTKLYVVQSKKRPAGALFALLKISLASLQCDVDIFKCSDGVTCGDVVLVVLYVRTITGGPDTRGGRLLGPGVNFDATKGIKRDGVLGIGGVREHTSFDKDTTNRDGLFFTTLRLVRESSNKLFT